MFAKFALPAALVAAAVAAAPAAEIPAGMKAGSPTLKSISNITFGPDGVLFLGDPTAATVYAVATNDTKPAGKTEVKLDKVSEKIGSLLYRGKLCFDGINERAAAFKIGESHTAHVLE